MKYNIHYQFISIRKNRKKRTGEKSKGNKRTVKMRTRKKTHAEKNALGKKRTRKNAHAEKNARGKKTQ